jgi:hypothetical protein
MSVNIREVFVSFGIDDAELLSGLNEIDNKVDDLIGNIGRLEDSLLKLGEDIFEVFTELGQIDFGGITTTPTLVVDDDMLSNFMAEVRDKFKGLGDILDGEDIGIETPAIDTEVRISEDSLPVDVFITNDSLENLDDLISSLDTSIVTSIALDDDMSDSVKKIEQAIAEIPERIETEQLIQDVMMQITPELMDDEGLIDDALEDMQQSLHQTLEDLGMDISIPIETSLGEVEDITEKRKAEPTFVESGIAGLEFAEYPDLPSIDGNLGELPDVRLGESISDETTEPITPTLERETFREEKEITKEKETGTGDLSATVSIGQVTINNGGDLEKFKRTMTETLTKALNEEAKRRR